MNIIVFPLMIAGWQWIAIVLIVLLLFGGKKIPELMRSLGKATKEFKSGMKDAEGEIKEIKKEIESDDDKK